MNSAKLNDWIQTAGIIALVVSLIFVGMEMRQTQDIARATLYQMRSDSSRELSTLMVENVGARQGFYKVIQDGLDSLTPDEAMQIRFTLDTVLGHFENSHYLYQLGFLSDEQWEADKRQLRNILHTAGGSPLWIQSRSNYRESFAIEVDQLLEE